MDMVEWFPELIRMKFWQRKGLIRLFFFLYCALMLWLLFIRYRDVAVTDYWTQVADRFNPVPFSSIGSMLQHLREDPRWEVLQVVVYNLGGNIGMFLPLGMLLPALFPKQRRFGRCMVTVAVIMTCVEFLQLVTLRGFCETDDVILNVLGAGLGYGFWRMTSK